MKKTFRKITFFMWLMFILNISVYALESIKDVNDKKVEIYGYGSVKFECPNNVKYKQSGVCEGVVKKGQYVKLPIVNEDNFVGWSTKRENSSCSGVIKGGRTVEITDDVIYYGCYKNKSNVVDTKDNDKKVEIYGYGSVKFECPDNVKYKQSGVCEGVVKKGQYVKLPIVNEDNFVGWSTKRENSSCSGVIKGGRTVEITDDVIYYGCYKSQSSISGSDSKNSVYTIKLNGNGTKRFGCPSGFTTASTDTVGICNGRVAKNKTFTLPTVSESGFKGWSTSKDCSVKPVTGSQKVTGNQVYYACFNSTTTATTTTSTNSSNNINGTTRPPVNATRWVNYSNNGFKCGQALFIKTCTGNICNAYDVNTKASLGTISDRYLTADYSSASKVCGSAAEAIGDRYAFNSGSNYSCGDELYITSCNNNICNFIRVNDKELTSPGTISSDYLKFGRADALAECAKITEEEVEIKSCNNVSKHGMEISGEYEVCYKDGATDSQIKDMLKDLYVCNATNGYTFDYSYATAIENTKKCDSKTKNCKEIYNVRCTRGKSAKPKLSVTSGNVESNNKGKVTVRASASDGRIVQYYYSESIEKAPTSTSNGWIDVNSNNFTIEISPGTIYIWVKDSNGNISYAVSGSVLDNVNTKTTLRKLEFKDANGNIQNPTNASAYNDTIKSSNYVRLSNDLRKDSEILADGFNPFSMEYKLEVSSPTVTVYATLTSTDSKYVSGYEPRTVNLNYGVNTVLIKIQDNEGKIRTYTILVTRTDDRNSDNTLNSLSVSAGKLDFNSNVTEYKVEIPNNMSNVEVKSTISSDKASYVSGYEPGNVSIKGDTTVKLIKVKSQTGSTRTYVITFVKQSKDIITDKTLQLRDLTIPGVYIPFEEEVANYSVSVEHEIDVINVNAVLKDKNSNIVFSSKRKSESGFIEGSSQGVPIEVGENFIEIKVTNSKNESSVYRITVIRKEYGLGISEDNTLKDLKVLGYDINFEPTKREYTVKIKQEKTLVITAVPNSNRAEVFIRGNEELTGFSTVRVKVVAENGNYETYSIDIKKDAFNKTIEIAAIVAGAVIILISSSIIIIKKKAKANREYFEE